MPYHIEKKDDQYQVIKNDDGKVMGKHDSEEKAKSQIAALYSNEDE